MEEQKNEQQSVKRKNVRWEYVLEPFNKPTYWDHAALSTEERRARGRRTVLVKEPKLEVGAFVKSEYDEPICNVVLKEMKSREVEDAQTSPELLSSSIIGTTFRQRNPKGRRRRRRQCPHIQTTEQDTSVISRKHTSSKKHEGNKVCRAWYVCNVVVAARVLFWVGK